jgi:ribulose-5-phosphate 4-epimerase/fuculose-1-phosphate aldolase
MRLSTTETSGRSLDDLLIELAEACRILDMEGHGDMTLGHMSVRDPNDRGAWVKRGGISLGEVRGPEDFVLIGFDGKVLAGSGARHVEWPIHTEIYLARPDVQSVAHSYPLYGSLLGATAAPITAVSREGCYFEGRVSRYSATSNLLTTPELGQGLAECLGSHYAVLMHNHGVSFCGRSVAECTVVGLMLERVCKAIVTISASGLEWSPARDARALQPATGAIPEFTTTRFWNYYRRKLARAANQAPARAARRATRSVS